MNIGFIGTGNMSRAIISGILKRDFIDSKNIYASDKICDALDKTKLDFNISTCTNNIEVVKKSNVIFLAVKPHYYENVINEVKDYATKDKIFVSMTPGKTIEFLEKHFGSDKKILRTMPNTPAMVNSAVTAICPNKNITAKELEFLKDIFRTFGIVEQIEEKLFDTVVAVSGSSPAYIFMIIEAMADAAVLNGMDRSSAYRLVAGAVMGSAKMVLETKKHPAELKDMVTSPSGTTIEALRVLEKGNLRSTIIEAMNAAHDKSAIL